MSIINNLNEFLAWRGFSHDEPYYWARCYYKYTACGPWVTFLLRDELAHEDIHPQQTAKIKCIKKQAVLTNANELADDYVSFLGFDKQGLSKQERTWVAYLELVDKFVADEAKQKRTGREIVITRRAPLTLHVTLPGYTGQIKETFKEVYYEDIGKKRQVRQSTECTNCGLEEAGPHPDDPQETMYKKADPDPDCRWCRGKGSYMKDYPIGEVMVVNNDNCVGIKVGSIVEGSEVCYGPETYVFPFDSAEFDKDEKYMEEFTSYYWERDNSTWYELVVGDNKVYYLHANWGDIKWDCTPPYPRLKRKVEAFINEHYDDIPEMPGIYEESKKDWKPARIPGTRATIYETYNDGEF